MHDTGLLSEWRYRQVCIEVQGLGYRKREPDGIPREGSQVLQKAFTALWAERMTTDRVAAELGWPRGELDALTFRMVKGASERTESGKVELRVL